MAVAMDGLNWFWSPVSRVFRRQRVEDTRYMQVTDNEPLVSTMEGPRIVSTPKPSRNLILYILAVSIFFNTVIPVAIYRKAIRNGSIEGPFPPREYEKVIFEDVATAEHFSDDLLPRGGGWTVIDDPERYNLPPGILLNGRYNKYGVSWAHQYHCLRMLRDEFWAHVENRSTLIGLSMNDNPTNSDVVKLVHLDHCHGYLLQAILCNMDMTIEYPTDLGISHGTIDGVGIAHTCTRREIFDEYMAAHWPGSENLENESAMYTGFQAYGHDH